MDATSALKSSNRPPTLSFLTLHLGSFTSLSPESFPSPTSSSRISPISPIAPNSGNSPSRSGFRWDEQAQQSGTSGPPFDTGQGYNGSVVLPRSSSSRDGFGSLTARRESSRSPLRTNGSIQPSQPSQPSADLSLPQIPSLSPISPISPHQESASTTNKNLGLALPLSVTGRSPSWTPGSAPSPSGSRTMPVESSRGHPLGPSLTIHIPSPLTPSSSIDNNGPPSPAVLRDSPLPRRRTIVESNPASSRSSPVKVSDVIGSLTPPQDASPEVPARRSSHDRGTMSMPVARPLTIVDTSFNSGDGSPKRLADKTSISDLKRVSPISPTSRRSLPRPPTGDRGSLAQPSIPKLRSLSNSIPPGAQSSALTTHPSQPPATSSTWPPLPGSHVSLAVPDTPQRAAAKVQHQSLVQKPQTTNSASCLPIVAGLADAGPYPSSPALTPRQPGPSNQGTAGISRTTQAGPSRPGQNPGPGPGGAAPQEEICLECMMRDRDLADVVVQGDGAWERGSDAAWEELQWREDALLKSIGSGSTMSRSVPSLDHSSDSESADHSTTSPPSTGHSFEDAGARQRMAVRRRNRALRRARRRELDWRVIKEIGWRGFRWEEGSAGEGLPSGFRGSRGGQLTQGGIKAIMTKVSRETIRLDKADFWIQFPSASQHRYENLHTYLCYQAVLVREIQLETQRLGHYLQPGDVPISSMLSYDGHNIIAGPRTSSVAWEAKHARELSEQLRGAFTSPQRAPQLSLVRPSPSSPAELANIANGRPVPPPLTRPLTQSYPDCGPGVTAHISPTSFTQPLNMRADHSMHGNGFKNPAFRQNEDWPEDDEELWEPSSAADGGLRPFSFAVRAGATATRGSSDGHGRRSLWGRWGGSVTSLFGGSHGDSGSMVDMQ